MRNPRKVVLIAFGILLATTAIAVERHKTGEAYIAPEIRPDKALVYLIRQSHLTAGFRTTYLFADDTFLATLDDDCYTYTYVEPGLRLLWTNWTSITREIDLSPGQSYYLDVFTTIAPVDQATGEALIRKASCYATPTPAEIAKADEHIANRYQKAMDKEGKKEKAQVPEVGNLAPASTPADTEGLVRLPEGTSAKLRFLETSTSAFSVPGEAIWFEAVEDAHLGEVVFLPKGTRMKGTVREAQKAKGGGREGVLEIEIPAIPAPDGTMIPVAGQIASSGEGKADTAAGVAIAVGALWSLAVKGSETYHLAGEEVLVRLRRDAWIRPVAKDDLEPPAVPVGEGVTLSVSAEPDALELRPDKRTAPRDVQLKAEGSKPPKTLEVYAVGDQILPEPLPPLGLEQRKSKWSASFDGWRLVHHMPVSEVGVSVPVRFRGTYEDGQPFQGTTAVTLKTILDKPSKE